MIISPIKTRLVRPEERDLFSFLDTAIKSLPEKSILVITSKIVSFFEGNFISKKTISKSKLVQQEADYYVPREMSPYHASLSIRESAFISSGGVDESNAAGSYILLPRDSQKTANQVRLYLKKRFQLNKVGVIITDSRSIPLRRGNLGVALAWSGFLPVKDYRGTKDLFGRKILYEVANVADALAVAAVSVMGEGNEKTPLAILTKLNHITFVNRNPNQKEKGYFFIQPENDLFAPLFNLKRLKKGRKGK